MSDPYKVGDRVTVRSTTYGVLDGGPDVGAGQIVEIFSDRGARILVVRVDGQPGRYLRLSEQVSQLKR